MICDLCDFHVAHSYCCGFGNRIPEEDWICDYCTGMISEDSFISDNDDENDSNSSLVEISSDELTHLNSHNQNDTRLLPRMF